MTVEEKEVYEKLIDTGIFFNPKVLYDSMYDLAGDMYDAGRMNGRYPYDINKDIFALNAKMINGENAYAKFLENKIYSLFNFSDSSILYDNNSKVDDTEKEKARVDDFIRTRITPTLALRYDDKKKRRKLTFSHELIFTKILSVLQMGFEIKLGDYKRINKTIKKHLD